MTVTDILSTIDAQISNLEQARTLLTDSGTGRRGKESASTHVVKAKAKRTLSPAGRKRIADAQRKRWAAQKKAAK
jgi:hypothetical protein